MRLKLSTAAASVYASKVQTPYVIKENVFYKDSRGTDTHTHTYFGKDVKREKA